MTIIFLQKKTNGMLTFSHETFLFFAKSFNEDRPFEKGFKFKNPMVSNDGKVRVYFDGFKKTIEKHKDEILNFFKS
jgi:hypothetical protein